MSLPVLFLREGFLSIILSFDVTLKTLRDEQALEIFNPAKKRGSTCLCALGSLRKGWHKVRLKGDCGGIGGKGKILILVKISGL